MPKKTPKTSRPVREHKTRQQPGAEGAAAGIDHGAPQILHRLFAIDPRSLALFRIIVGLLLLVDVLTRATDLSAMYTDVGMFPRSEVARLANPWNWSLHFGGGSAVYQAGLFALAGVLAFALLVGFHTRIATLGSWILLVSVQHRAPGVLSGADILLRMLLFWSVFLPLGRVGSVDTRRRTNPGGSHRPRDETPVVSIASAAILLQMALMYLFSAILKTNADWLGGGALAGALAHDLYASRLGAAALAFPTLLSILTWGTLAIEYLAPLLLFSPVHTGRLRLATISTLAAMHLAIALLMVVGPFSFVSLAGLCLFLPGHAWDGVTRWAARNASRPPEASATATPAPCPARTAGTASRLARIIGMATLAYVLVLNLDSVGIRPLARLKPEQWAPLTTGLGLGQRWGMFEAIPSRDGWCVAEATLSDGSRVDLLRDGAPVDWKRPEFPAGLHPNHRWRKLFRELSYDDALGFQFFRSTVADYLHRDWNARNPADRHVERLDLTFCSERILDPKPDRPIALTVRETLVRLEPGSPSGLPILQAPMASE